MQLKVLAAAVQYEPRASAVVMQLLFPVVRCVPGSVLGTRPELSYLICTLNIIVIQFYKCRYGGSEQSSDLPKVIQLVNDGAEPPSCLLTACIPQQPLGKDQILHVAFKTFCRMTSEPSTRQVSRLPVPKQACFFPPTPVHTLCHQDISPCSSPS